VSTVAPITNIVANVAGDRARISGVVPEGTNSHTYDPPPQVSQLMEDADVVFVNGLQLEEPTFELAEQNAPEDAADRQDRRRGAAGGGLPLRLLLPRRRTASPTRTCGPTRRTRSSTPASSGTPSSRPTRREGGLRPQPRRLRREGAGAVRRARGRPGDDPEGKKQLLTYHDAYAYFAKTYDWEVIGAVQPSNFEDPQPKEIARIIDQVRERDVP
jgi:hypothetical protein